MRNFRPAACRPYADPLGERRPSQLLQVLGGAKSLGANGSLYFRQEGVISHNRISFEEFCENHAYASDTCSHPTLHSNQLDWLTDEDGRIGVDYVYKIEEFESSLAEIREMTNGRINLQFLVANTNPLSRADRYRDMFTDRTRQLIARRFEKDIDTFRYAF